MTKTPRLLSSAIVAFGLLTAAEQPQAQAATSTASILVTATVLSYCLITAAPLPFGNYTQAVLAANTTVVATCTSGTTYNVGLDLGVGTGATISARKMTLTAGSATLNYALYQNSALTTAWGPTIGTNTVTGTGTGLPQTITVYGQIPANQLAAPGAYTDTVTATLTY